ncbi:unnamed protein product [marine sediment metagenome]|uniref:Uncharacterized protein n=1 Tax=marine sediment metagenome TaxID=412755 RepID=X1FIJ4_9ZZZZ
MICETKECCLDRFYLYRAKQYNNLDEIANQIGQAGSNLKLGKPYDAGVSLGRANAEIEELIFNLIYGGFLYEPEHWADYHWLELDMLEPAGAVTMDAIINAMKAAEPHEPLLFIAYLEAFKASAWDATFDERFFADLVKKWKIWG